MLALTLEKMCKRIAKKKKKKKKEKKKKHKKKPQHTEELNNKSISSADKKHTVKTQLLNH
jgi:hypothetical protein